MKDYDLTVDLTKKHYVAWSGEGIALFFYISYAMN